MTNADLGTQIDTLAVQIRAKSSSLAVDAWADQIRALVAQIQPEGVTVIERRMGVDRRSGMDVAGSPLRRRGDRRRIWTPVYLEAP